MANIEEIKKLVNEFYSLDYKKDTDKLTNIFQKILVSRNNLALESGFENYFEMQKNHIQKIPDNEYAYFEKQKTNFSNTFNPQLIGFSLPVHFLFSVAQLDISFPDGVLKLFNEFQEIENVKNKINLISNSETASFKFLSESEKYIVNIPKTNPNQKIAMLIHELSHIVCQERSDHKINSVYESEKGALEIERIITKKISTDFYLANLREYLMCFVRSEFEKLIFQNPSQNISKTYLTTLEKYLGKPDNDMEFKYLIDDRIIMKPLTDLSSSVALVNLTQI